MLSTRDLARGQAPERIVMCAALPLAPLVTVVLERFHHNQRAGDKEADREGDHPASPRADRTRAPVRDFASLYYIFELHDDDKQRHASEYINRFEMKSGIYRFLRDYNGGLPIPAERSTACIKDKYASCHAAVNLELPLRPSF